MGSRFWLLYWKVWLTVAAVIMLVSMGHIVVQIANHMQ